MTEQDAVRQLDFESLARQIFDRFLILRPHVSTEGLFRSGTTYYIVTPAAHEPDVNGRTLKQWFDGELRTAGAPLELTATRPPSAIQLSERTLQEILDGYGVVRNHSALVRDVAFGLSENFPFRGMTTREWKAVALVDRPLSSAEELLLRAAYARIGAILPLEIEVADQKRAPVTPNPNDGPIIRPAVLAPPSTPHVLRRRVAEDDECWRQWTTWPSQSTSMPSSRSLRPEAFSSPPGEACLVSTTFEPANIRTYLSLYSSVILVAPLAERLDATLEALSVTADEFARLASLGFVKLLLPQSIERYDQRWLARLAEEAPDGLLFTRRLATITAQDQYTRNPLFGLPVTASEKRMLLKQLHLLGANDSPLGEGPASIARSLSRALSHYWEIGDYILQMRGAMAAISSGLARFATEVVRERFQRDLAIELGTAALNVSWAGAFRAHLVPDEGAEYSSTKADGFLIALSSGLSKDTILSANNHQFQLAEGLLAFDNDTDVIEFATGIASGDLGRFRALVATIAQNTDSPEQVAERVAAWNSEVRRYERKPNRLKDFGIGGLLMGAAGAATAAFTDLRLIPAIMPFLPFLLTKTTEDIAPAHARIGLLTDWFNGHLSDGTAPQAVLLSRLRKRVRGMSTK